MKMNKEGLFIPGYMLNKDINPQAPLLIARMTPTYQEAFSQEPWFEVSKCVSNPVNAINCPGGFSSLATWALCSACERCPVEAAYTDEDLNRKLTAIGRKDSMLYIERLRPIGALTFAAIAYKATASAISEEKYSDVPAMTGWLEDQLGDGTFVWLDEAFANRFISPRGNLSEFTTMARGFTNLLRTSTSRVAYRTISPAMKIAAERFEERVSIYEREKQVPDRRDFIVIDLSEGRAV